MFLDDDFHNVKKNYRFLSLKFHPDKNGNANTHNVTINNINSVHELWKNLSLDLPKIQELLNNNQFTDNPIPTITLDLFENFKSWKKIIPTVKDVCDIYLKIMKKRDRIGINIIRMIFTSHVGFNLRMQFNLYKLNNEKIMEYYHASFDTNDKNHSPFKDNYINEPYNKNLFTTKNKAFFIPVFTKMIEKIKEEFKVEEGDGLINTTKKMVVNHKGKIATAALLGVGLFAYKQYQKNKSTIKRESSSSSRKSRTLSKSRSQSRSRTLSKSRSQSRSRTLSKSLTP